MERLALLALVLSSISAAPVLKDTKCAGILNNSPMAPITALNAAGINEIKRVTASLLQAIGALMEQLYVGHAHFCNVCMITLFDWHLCSHRKPLKSATLITILAIVRW